MVVAYAKLVVALKPLVVAIEAKNLKRHQHGQLFSLYQANSYRYYDGVSDLLLKDPINLLLETC
jgi:hypothetical protein